MPSKDPTLDQTLCRARCMKVIDGPWSSGCVDASQCLHEDLRPELDGCERPVPDTPSLLREMRWKRYSVLGDRDGRPFALKALMFGRHHFELGAVHRFSCRRC